MGEKVSGYSVCTIHGSIQLEEQVRIEGVFRNEAQVLVATEAAGEGINLQFCLFEKLQEIERGLGSDKVFDVLGDIFYGKDLAQLMVQAAASARSLDEILAELYVRVDAEYLAQMRERLDESLATRYIDYTRIRGMANQAKEHRLIPEYTEAFFKKAPEAAEGEWRERKETAFRHPEATFLSFGQPLFEAVLAWVERDLAASLQRGAIFTDPDGWLDGVVLFYEGEVQDGLGQVAGRRLFALYADRKMGEVRPANPAVLWDLAEGGEQALRVSETLRVWEDIKQQALSVLLPALADY